MVMLPNQTTPQAPTAGQPTTTAFAPRQWVGQRPPGSATQSPQGDGSSMAQGNPAKAKPRFQTATPPTPQAQTAPTGSSAPPTFAQMQASGQARPTPSALMMPPPATMAPSPPPATIPPTPTQPSTQPATPSQPAPPQPTAIPPSTTPGAPPQGLMTPPTQIPTPTGPPATVPPTQQTIPSAMPAGGGISGQLQSAVSAALSNSGRYNDPGIDAQRKSATAALQQQFGGQQQSLDEEMARRGLGASTIGSQYQTNLAGQQDNALSSMNASLLKDAAANAAADRSSALGAGQSLLNSQTQGDQFSQSLAQALKLGTMSDTTANRGIDAQAALANNDLMLRVAAALGLPVGAGGTGTNTGTTGGTAGTGTTGGSGTPIGGGSVGGTGAGSGGSVGGGSSGGGGVYQPPAEPQSPNAGGPQIIDRPTTSVFDSPAIPSGSSPASTAGGSGNSPYTPLFPGETPAQQEQRITGGDTTTLHTDAQGRPTQQDATASDNWFATHNSDGSMRMPWQGGASFAPDNPLVASMPGSDTLTRALLAGAQFSGNDLDPASHLPTAAAVARYNTPQQMADWAAKYAAMQGGR